MVTSSCLSTGQVEQGFILMHKGGPHSHGSEIVLPDKARCYLLEIYVGSKTLITQ